MFRRRQRSVSLQPEPAPLSLASPGYDVPAQFNHNHLYQRYHQQPRHQVSPQHHRHRRRLTTIGDLPFEILQLIFREILEDPRRVKSISRPYELKLNFPYNVAFTCKGWSVVAFRMAELWTNIRVYLGYHGRLTPLRSLQAQLRASGSQTINAWIKMARDPTLDDPIARHDANSNFPIQHMIHDVFQMLSQHAQRIDAIYINNSSNGQYNSDGGNAYSPCGNFSWVGSRRTTHPFASLSEVVLDGASFLDVCSVRNFWASTRMSRLGIRHLHVRDQSYSMRQLICHLATIPCLTALEFEDIYIADMCGAAAAGPSISDASGHDILRTVTTLAFIKVEEQFIRSLYANASALPFADVHFHECDRLRLDHDLEIHAKNIHLNDMHGSAFRRLVRQFTGRGIYIDNCNALDDQFLHQLADAVQRDPRIMSFLDFLSIDDCQNFTFAAFSRFLQAVTTQTGRRQKVALHCMGVPRISGREKQWLKQMTERPSGLSVPPPPHQQRSNSRKSSRPLSAPAQEVVLPLLPCLLNGSSPGPSNSGLNRYGPAFNLDISSLPEDSSSDGSQFPGLDMTMNDYNNGLFNNPPEVPSDLSSSLPKRGLPILPSIDGEIGSEPLVAQPRPPPKQSSLQDLKSQTSSDRTILDTAETDINVSVLPQSQSAFVSSMGSGPHHPIILPVSADYDWATFINAYSWGRWDPHRTPNLPRGGALSFTNNVVGVTFPPMASSVVSPPPNPVVTAIPEASSSEELSAEKTMATENTQLVREERKPVFGTLDATSESSSIVTNVGDSNIKPSIPIENTDSSSPTAEAGGVVIQMPPKPSLQPTLIPQSPPSPLPLSLGAPRQGTTSLQNRFRSTVPGRTLNITLPTHRMRSSFSISSAPSPDLTSPVMSGVSSAASPLTPIIPTHSITIPSNSVSSSSSAVSSSISPNTMVPSPLAVEIGDKQASAATLRWAAARVNIAPLALPSPEHELTDPMRGVMATVPGRHPSEDFTSLEGTIAPGIGGRKTRLSGFWEGMTDVDEPVKVVSGGVTASIGGVVEGMGLGEKDHREEEKRTGATENTNDNKESGYDIGQAQLGVGRAVGRPLGAKSAPALLPDDDAEGEALEQPNEPSDPSLQAPLAFQLPSMPVPGIVSSSSNASSMEVMEYPSTSAGHAAPSDSSTLPRRVCLTRQTSSPLPASTPREAVYSKGPSQNLAGDMATGSGAGMGMAAVRQGRAAKEEQMFLELAYLAPPNPPEELERRRALYKFNIWNTGPDLNFDRIAHLAKLVFSTKGVFISLIDGNEQWFKSQWGVSASSHARIHSFCAHTILQRGDEPMVILDTHRDWRFAKNPFVQDSPYIRFYAGAPLRTHDGYNIGTLSIIDDAPREEFAPRQRHTLKEFAAIAMREMELWRDKIQLRIRDRIQTSMEQFSRECLEIENQTQSHSEGQQHPEALIGASMDKVYDRAAKLVKRTLDVEGVVVMDVSHCEVLETMGSEGSVSVIMHSGEHGVESKSRTLTTEEYHKLTAFFGKFPDGKISEGIMPICFRPFLPTHIQYALTVPIYNIDRRPFALLVAYNASEQTKRYLEGHELSYLRAIGVIILSAVLKRRMILADKAKSLFISNISHELRTPLHGILAAAELLAEGPLDHSQESFLHTVQACGTSLQETVNHVLDFTKLSGNSKSGGVETSSLLGKVDLMQLVEDAVDGCWIGHRARSAGMVESAIGSVYSPPKEDHGSTVVETVIDIGYRAKGWTLKCEKGGIRRVLMNLFGNSLKFTSRGYIHVVLRELPLSDGDPPDKARLELAVLDTGKGISQNFLKNQMFHPFSQENPLQTGTGLGLAIVNSIVHSENVGGKVDVWSEEGVGTELKVSFIAEELEDSTPSAAPVSFKTDDDDVKPPSFSLVGFDPAHRGAKLLSKVIEQYLTNWWGLDIDTSGNGNIVILNEDASLVQQATEHHDISHPFIILSSMRGYSAIMKLATEHERIGGFCRILFKPGGPSRLRLIVALAIHAYKIGSQALDADHAASSLRSAAADDAGSGHRSFHDLDREREKAMLGTGIPRRYSEDSRRPTRTHSTHSPPPTLGVRSTAVHSLTPWKNTSNSSSEGCLQRNSPDFSISEPTSSISTLPVGSDGSLLRSSMTSYELPDQRPLKILVVEDNSILRSLLIKWLRQKGYDFREAVDGQDGVSVYEKDGPFDVVLLDLSMPVLDGVGATKEIRRIESDRKTSLQDGESVPTTRILALTGMSSLEDKRRAFEAGVDGYLVKPVAFKTLNEMFSKLGFTPRR